MLNVSRIILAELVSEEAPKLDLEDLLNVAREVEQGLSFCLARALPCAELIKLMLDVSRSISQIRLAKVFSGKTPKNANESTHVDLKFLKEVIEEVITYYAILIFGLTDYELRVPVKFEEDVTISGRRYRAFSSRLMEVSEAIALRRAGAKIRIILPRDFVERLTA